MAFVSQAERKINQLPQPVYAIGPGSYNTDQSKQKNIHGFAPFYSTTSRPSIINNTIIPGPGHYTLSGTMIHPNVTTYSNSQNIIIKLNSCGTQPFTSKRERFSSNNNQMPGPGEYIHGKAKPGDRPKLKNKKQLSLPQKIKNTPSIVSKTVYLNQNRNKQLNKNRGDPIIISDFLKKKKGIKASIWSKDKINRFGKRCFTEIGPGRYHHQMKEKQRKKINNSVSFTSKTVRSMFDTIIYKTSNNQTLYLRETNHFKTQSPAPGTYHNHSPRNQAQKYKNKTFGSNFIKNNQIPFYNVDEYFRLKSFNKKYVPFNVQTKRTVSQDNKTIDQPGPGYYQISHANRTSILKTQLECFGSLVRRPFNNNCTEETVGPGYYQPFRCHTEQVKSSSIFKSNIPRTFQLQNQYDGKFGQYDISQTDISRKALNTKIHRDNLLKINCQIPGFDRNSPRFRHYDTEPAYEDQQFINKQRDTVLLARKQQERQKIIKNMRQQINQSKGCAIGRGGDRFGKAIKCPGVGDYSIRNNWTKKSYNIKYSVQNKT